MTLLEDAIGLALISHRGQVDKGKNEYILHPLRLMLKMRTDEERIVAVLHDIIEDGAATIEDLKELKLPKNIRDALKCISRTTGEDYDDYISRVKTDLLATRVKIADLQDNMDLSRIPHPQQEDFDRVRKYEKALDLLLASRP